MSKHPKGVGDYQFTKLLGEGGMGSVFLARRKGQDRDVAIKLLHKDLAGYERYVKRFHREAKTGRSLSHPNLVAVLDSGTDAATQEHYTVYELVDGGDLADVIEKGPLEERRALKLTRAIAGALSYANAKGIVHRDVKPDNVLLTKDGTPKLADLGLAKVLDPDVTHLTRAGTVLGTPHYMAPEQAQGIDQLDGRTDQYALGLCLWTMLYAELPFDPDVNASPRTLILRRLERDLPDVREKRPEIGAGTVALIRRMTMRDREDRYPDASYVVAAIDRLLSAERPRAIPQPPAKPAWTPPPAQPATKPPGLVLAVVAAVILLILGGITAAKLLSGE